MKKIIIGFLSLFLLLVAGYFYFSSEISPEIIDEQDRKIEEQIQKKRETLASIEEQKKQISLEMDKQKSMFSQRYKEKMQKACEIKAPECEKMQKNTTLSEYSEPLVQVLPVAHAEAKSNCEYSKPADLFFSFLRCDGYPDIIRITQNPREHFANNGLLAYDIGTKGNKIKQYAPDWMNQEREWNAQVVDWHKSCGQALVLISEENRVILCHLSNITRAEKVKTGEYIGVTGGCGDDHNEGASTGCHAHIEYFLFDKLKNDWQAIEYSFESPTSEHEKWNKTTSQVPSALTVFFTSYNAEEGQTDSSPCTGAIGVNVCEMYQSGERPIALSRDLIKGKSNGYCTSNCPFKYGQKVKLVSSEPQCNFVGVLVDTMNKRYKNRGDIFHLSRSKNTSCEAQISTII
jgi:hypothetical protein